MDKLAQLEVGSQHSIQMSKEIQIKRSGDPRRVIVRGKQTSNFLFITMEMRGKLALSDFCLLEGQIQRCFQPGRYWQGNGLLIRPHC